MEPKDAEEVDFVSHLQSTVKGIMEEFGSNEALEEACVALLGVSEDPMLMKTALDRLVTLNSNRLFPHSPRRIVLRPQRYKRNAGEYLQARKRASRCQFPS